MPERAGLTTFPYNRTNAVNYANEWAYRRNPKYLDFQGLGGDCTNFASQCVYAGSKVMNFTPIYGWYYISASDRTASWTGVKYLYNFLTKNKAEGPYAVETDIYEMEPGDIIQLGDENNEFYHTLVVTKVEHPKTKSNIYISTHTFDANNRQLDTYDINTIRFLHIQGVRGYSN